MRPLNNKLETYNTASKNRGYVFMINNVKYKVATQYRNGAKIDEKNLTELFTQMNFKVDVHNDKKAKVSLKTEKVIEEEENSGYHNSTI